MKSREDLLSEVLKLIEKFKITAYEIEQNTELSAVGIQKIINGDTKKPLASTLKAIKEYIDNKYVNVENNKILGNHNKINQGGIYNDNNTPLTNELINLLHEKDKQIAKRDEQIDKLLHILSSNK